MKSMLQIRLLGELDIKVGGKPLPNLRGKTGFWLLGILTLQANRAVDRDFLAGTLWPESAPEQGRANLRRALTDLRQALGQAAERLTNPSQQTVSLRVEPNEADVLAFRAGALDVYRGELMPGCALEWVETERRIFAETFLAKGEKQAAFLDPAEALLLLERLRASDPLRESLLRLQLSALCQQGNRAEAQQSYYAFRRLLLAQRLGEPSAETQRHWKQLQTTPPPPNAQTPTLAVSPASAPTVPSPVLPSPLMPLLGREREMETISRLLAQHRLVTLTGLGGIGKTRLALEVAHQGTHALFVELAETRDAAQLTQTLESLLPASGLLAAEGENTPLLVLDNFEQLVGPEAGRVVRALLDKHSTLRCLITSRRALGLSGEQQVSVEPLDLPRYPGSPDRLGEFASINLLVERIRLVQPAFELTTQNAPALVALCQQAEGIPLALELLAAHLRSLSPEMLLAQVQRARLPLLARREPGETPRHQSLWRIVESSVALLSEAEKNGFYKMAVFRGGWSAEAAQAVCAPEDPLFLVSLLETLTDNSLIRFTSNRYSQLETLREFSLANGPEAIRAEAERAHAVYYLALAEQHANTPENFTFLDTEQGNLRAAFDTFLDQNDTDAALRWARAQRLYWFHRQGGRAFFERLLHALTAPAERAEVQADLGTFCANSGAHDAARAFFNEALVYARGTNNTLNEARLLTNLATIELDQGNWEPARVGLEEALILWRTLSNARALGLTLTNLSIAAMNQGDLETAEKLLAEGLALRQAQGDNYGIAANLVNQGGLELRQGAPWKAETTFRQALARFQQMGDRRAEAAALEGIVEAFLDQNEPAEALRYLREAIWLRQEYKIPETALQNQLHERVRQVLGEAVYNNTYGATSPP